MISLDTQERRTIRAKALSARFRKSRSIEKYVWQDKNHFTLDVPLNSRKNRVYGFENKDDIYDNHLFHHTNTMRKIP